MLRLTLYIRPGLDSLVYTWMNKHNDISETLVIIVALACACDVV